MKRSATIAVLLCSWMNIVCANSEMLYCRQVPEELVNRIASEIQMMQKDQAIQWIDLWGRTRKTFEFGISFKEIEENHRIVRYPIPPFVKETRAKLVELFHDQLKEKDPEKYENCIITLYSKGDGIKAHTDRDYFGPDILGLIIKPDCSDDLTRPASRLYFTNPDFDPIFLSEEAGTAFLITGELRTKWLHQLAPVASERISIQFRTVNIKEAPMQNTSITLPEMTLVGISVRTSYKQESEKMKGNIFPCVQRYFHGALAEKILHRKKPGTTFCAYTDYESDYSGEYTYFIGEEVTSADDPLPEGFKKLIIPRQHYAKFTTHPAPMPDVIVNAWTEIWRMSPQELGGKRRYDTDFEIYDERAADHQNIVLDVYVGISS